MPKSKRARVVHLSKVDKKGKELTLKLFSNIRECLDTYQHCFVFRVANMRNSYLKNVRAELSDSRLFFGKTKVMAKALGHTREDEYQPATSQLARHLAGNVGLLFTNREVDAVRAYFGTLAETDFARAGTTATRDFTIPPGVVYASAGEVDVDEDTLLPHTLEPELRRLLVPTTLEKGKVVLHQHDGYVVCRAGDLVDSRQTRLLKMFGVEMAEFRVQLLAYWSAATSTVTEIPADDE